MANVGRPLGFVLSIPERALRSAGALSGGLVREIGAVAVPARLRRSNLYRLMVDVTVRFLIEQVGEVEGVYPDGEGSEGRLASNFLLKRGASHGIELLGILTLHVSPIWVLAALADATGAGHDLIQRIAQALKDEGLLDAGSEFGAVDQILDGLENTSAQLARTLNMPPVSLVGLREEWGKLRNALPALPASKLPSLERLEEVWQHLVSSALAENRGVFTLGATLALTTLTELPGRFVWLSRAAGVAARKTGAVLGEELLMHYVDALNEISKAGFFAYWRKGFRPYLAAAAGQFAPGHESSTERLLRRVSAARTAARGEALPRLDEPVSKD